MLRNYYYLNRTVVELNKILSGGIVTEIYSQEKNSLLLSIPTEESPYRHLHISTNPLLPFLIIKEDHRKAKKNILFFNVLNRPQKIKSLEISKNDRLIKICLENIELFFSVMGGNTNVYFVKNGQIFAELHKSKDNSGILEQITKTEFTSQNVFHKIDEHLFENFEPAKIKKEYSFIPKEMISEMKFRYSAGKSILDLFHEILKELYFGKIRVFENEIEEKIRFVPEKFQTFPTENEILFDNCNSAISKFLQKHFRFESINTLKKEISRQLFKEIERTASKLNNLKGRIETGDRSNEYYNFGNLLLSNRYLLKKGMETIKILDYSTNEEVEIQLNPKKSPQELIDYYFGKAKDEKVNFKVSEQLFESSFAKFNKLKMIEIEFENAISVDDLDEIKLKLKISDKKNEKKKVTDGAKLREFLIDGKYQVLVGRDSKSNDMLSIKIAKQNDYWFHARGLPGSHVVLRVENTKEAIPKSILKNVAQIAAFYSKAKTAGTAPVSYTLAKFVRKKKGMEPGKVLIEKEQVLLVKPEIPTNCEMISEE